MEDTIDDKSMRKGYNELKKIVYDLASARDPSARHMRRDAPLKCPLCEKQTTKDTRKGHFPECPYRRAVEWVGEMEKARGSMRHGGKRWRKKEEGRPWTSHGVSRVSRA